VILAKRYKWSIRIVLLLTAIGCVLLLSPQYLLYSTSYKKSDAIIILLGPDFKARKKEANELIRKGMTDYLIIPAYRKAYKINGAEQFLLPYLKNHESDHSRVISYPAFYEDTHIEIIEAQRVMSDYGLKSAIFVSSPHHMRRIKIIADKVFKPDQFNFYFVATRYENIPFKFWELSSSDWRKIRREYSKILWFMIYYFWSEYIGFH